VNVPERLRVIADDRISISASRAAELRLIADSLERAGVHGVPTALTPSGQLYKLANRLSDTGQRETATELSNVAAEVRNTEILLVKVRSETPGILERYRQLETLALQSFGARPDPESITKRDIERRIRTLALLHKWATTEPVARA